MAERNGTIDYDALAQAPRLLMECELTPLQGHRFQPTGFADLGPARYTAPDGTEMLLVESAQSIANRLEAAMWDDASDDLIAELHGLPYIRVALPDRKVTTITESHRLNSPFMMLSILKNGDGSEQALQTKMCSEVGFEKGKAWDTRSLAGWLLKHDPNGLIHGLFLSSVQDGRMRLPRLLAGFIEASGASPAESGLSRREEADPTGAKHAALIAEVPDEFVKELGYEKPVEYKNKLKENVKNIIGHRTEFVAKQMKAYFNLDLALLRGYGLPDEANRLLIALSLFKIRRFLSTGLRLRTACDLEPVNGLRVTRPDKGFDVPDDAALLGECETLIGKCTEAKLFADPAVTEVHWKSS